MFQHDFSHVHAEVHQHLRVGIVHSSAENINYVSNLEKKTRTVSSKQEQPPVTWRQAVANLPL